MFVAAVITTILSVIYALFLWLSPNEAEPLAIPLLIVPIVSLILSFLVTNNKVALITVNVLCIITALTYLFFRFIFAANP